MPSGIRSWSQSPINPTRDTRQWTAAAHRPARPGWRPPAPWSITCRGRSRTVPPRHFHGLLLVRTGAGSRNSSSSWLMAAGTAPCRSNQYLAAAISWGVSGQSFQLPKGRQAKISQGFLTGTFRQDERDGSYRCQKPSSWQIAVVLVAALHLAQDFLLPVHVIVILGFLPALAGQFVPPERPLAVLDGGRRASSSGTPLQFLRSNS